MARRRRKLWPSLRGNPSASSAEGALGKRVAGRAAGEAAAEADVESPCTGDCRLDDVGVCVDCRRTIDEITQWGSLSNADKRSVLACAARRTVDD